MGDEKTGEESSRSEKERGRKLAGFIIYSLLEEAAIGLAILIPLLIFVPPLLILGAVIVVVVLGIFTAVKVYLYRSVMLSAAPAETLVGRMAMAVIDFKPSGEECWTGKVRIQGEEWLAVASSPVANGEQVVVTAISGLRLHVASIDR